VTKLKRPLGALTCSGGRTVGTAGSPEATGLVWAVGLEDYLTDHQSVQLNDILGFEMAINLHQQSWRRGGATFGPQVHGLASEAGDKEKDKYMLAECLASEISTATQDWWSLLTEHTAEDAKD
jgi:hypothetical protein